MLVLLDIVASLTLYSSNDGGMPLSEADIAVVALVLSKVPQNYKWKRIAIIDNPSKLQLEVHLDTREILGIHHVTRVSGEWTNVSHKHKKCSGSTEKTKAVEWEGERLSGCIVN